MRKAKAFTLIELLVVIAIIALLMAILLPVLERVKKEAKTIRCQAIMHQWALLLNSLANETNGRLVEEYAARLLTREYAAAVANQKESWMGCRTGQFAYYVDCFEYEMLCPTATKLAGPGGIGSASTAWFCPVHPWRQGSYGVNGYSPAYSISNSISPEIRKKAWQHINYKGVANVPLFLDCALWAEVPEPTSEPPQYEDVMDNSRPMSMDGFCINRHNGFVNCLFMDWSIRKVGLKELWTLKWHREFNTAGPWTKAGHVQPDQWPVWMRRLKDY
jgi:prepilin-type N-terminal cleavage/methylation domain-containing protein/prepilin-type processing-associated H-X9-DG protein